MSQRPADATLELTDPKRPAPDAARVQRVALVLHHAGGARIVPLVPGEEVEVGRGEEASACIDDPSLSRRHARFRLSPETGRVEVEDLGSTNGTRIGGRAVTRGELAPGAEAELGAVIAAVHVLTTADDAGRALAGHETFRQALDVELRRSRFFGRPLATIMAMPQVRSPGAMRKLLPKIEERLRPIDSMSFYSDEVVEVLLPELDRSGAASLASGLLAEPGVALLLGIGSFPSSATSAEELLDVTRAALLRATAQDPVVIAERDEAVRLPPAPEGTEGPICESPVMKELYRSVAKVARAAIPVLLLAETGAGKEVVARFLHDASPRRSAPLVSVNCAAIPASLLESTLFGHEKGAFTGASAQHAGVFESAARGTVFLDEIGELPPPAQAALLRVLETKTIQRVGSTKDVPVDVRVVAATHRDLAQMVTAGLFRQDLLYRLNTMTVAIPPLRKRREEIPQLAARFLVQANQANGTSVTGITPEAMEILLSHHWPGNVRELKNVIERAVVVAAGPLVSVEDLPTSLVATPAAADRAESDAADASRPDPEDFRTKMDRLEVQVLLDALRACDWNQTHAARRLGMPLRTLVHKIKTHGLKRLGYAQQPKSS